MPGIETSDRVCAPSTIVPAMLPIPAKSMRPCARSTRAAAAAAPRVDRSAPWMRPSRCARDRARVRSSRTAVLAASRGVGAVAEPVDEQDRRHRRPSRALPPRVAALGLAGHRQREPVDGGDRASAPSAGGEHRALPGPALEVHRRRQPLRSRRARCRRRRRSRSRPRRPPSGRGCPRPRSLATASTVGCSPRPMRRMISPPPPWRTRFVASSVTTIAVWPRRVSSKPRSSASCSAARRAGATPLRSSTRRRTGRVSAMSRRARTVPPRLGARPRTRRPAASRRRSRGRGPCRCV